MSGPAALEYGSPTYAGSTRHDELEGTGTAGADALHCRATDDAAVAQQLGLTLRQVERLYAAYKVQGAEGLGLPQARRTRQPPVAT